MFKFILISIFFIIANKAQAYEALSLQQILTSKSITIDCNKIKYSQKNTEIACKSRKYHFSKIRKLLGEYKGVRKSMHSLHQAHRYIKALTNNTELKKNEATVLSKFVLNEFVNRDLLVGIQYCKTAQPKSNMMTRILSSFYKQDIPLEQKSKACQLRLESVINNSINPEAISEALYWFIKINHHILSKGFSDNSEFKKIKAAIASLKQLSVKKTTSTKNTKQTTVQCYLKKSKALLDKKLTESPDCFSVLEQYNTTLSDFSIGLIP